VDDGGPGSVSMIGPMHEKVVHELVCVECGRVPRENERGWTARLTVDDEVVVYCPECDEREFGDGDD
jgi:hypothetical protein